MGFGERDDRRTRVADGTAPSRCRWSSTFGAEAKRRRKARESRRGVTCAHRTRSRSKPVRFLSGRRPEPGAVCLFLLRDADGGSPGKRLFGLRLIRRGGSAAGPIQSLLRNLTLLVPGWNLIELASLIRREDGRRPGDRAAGTALVEA